MLATWSCSSRSSPAAGGVPVLCSHGDVIWALVEVLEAAGTRFSGPVDVRKGSILILEVESGSVNSARLHPARQGVVCRPMSDPHEDEPSGARALPRPGLLALAGGAEWQAGCDYDVELLERSGADEVLVASDSRRLRAPGAGRRDGARWFAVSVGAGPDGAPPRAGQRGGERGRGPRGALHLPLRRLAAPPALGAEGLAVFEALVEAWRGAPS